jgi:TPR repeat protein
LQQFLRQLSSYSGFYEGQLAYENGDYVIALEEFKLSSRDGYAEDQSNLGNLYRVGRSLEQYYKEALNW